MPTSRSCLLAVTLALAACGVDTETTDHVAFVGPGGGPIGDPVPAPIDPFITCVWNVQPPPNQNIGLTGYGYWGDKRGFRIHHGNYNSFGDYLEYKIEVIWNMPGGCAGTNYYLRFPNHGLQDHIEIEVRGGQQVLKGRVAATRGSLPVLYNQNDVALPTNKLGPFAIKANMVGGGAGMSDTIAFTLLDAQILTRLPPPVFYNGVAPVSQFETDELATVYDDLYEDNEYLFKFFTFRMVLDAMTSTDRQNASDNIDIAINQPGLIHLPDLLWEEAHHVDHGATNTPVVIADIRGFGGFWNGHRNLIETVEERLRALPDVPAFGRVPAWDSLLVVPAEFAIGIVPARYPPFQNGSLAGGSDLEVAYRAANICTNFATSLSASPTLAGRLLDEELALKIDVEGWHNGVHSATVRGDMLPIDYAASVPLFYAWHTTVDTIWRNWQLCEAGYHPLLYSYPEL
jgi:hypothetical protein